MRTAVNEGDGFQSIAKMWLPNKLRFSHDTCDIYIQNTNVLLSFSIYFADALMNGRGMYYGFGPMLNEEGKMQFLFWLRCVANELMRL